MESARDSTSTDRLLQAAGNGDAAALNELIAMHREYLRRVIQLRLDPALRGRVDASDIIQETQVVIARRFGDFRDRRPTSFKLWLRGEAMQQIAMEYRRHVGAAKRSVHREHPVSDISSQLIARNLLRGTPSKIAEQKETVDQVRELVGSLPPSEREIIELRYVEELTNAEASELLQIEPATARKRHGRALKRLLELMVHAGLANTPE